MTFASATQFVSVIVQLHRLIVYSTSDDTIIIITPRPAAAGVYRLLTGRHQSAKQFPFPSAIEPGTFCQSWWWEVETVAHGRGRAGWRTLQLF